MLFLPTSLFWATYEQQGNTIPLWADDYTDRHINLLLWHGEIPVTWFQAFNPFMIFAFTPFVLMLWARQAARGTEPSTVTKMAIGCFGVALANLIMLGAVWQAGGGPQASWMWLFAYFVVITIGELYLSPIGLSLVSKVSPGRVVSMMMGVWLATSFVGNFIGGWLGSFWTVMDKSAFFLMIAGVAAVAGLVIQAFNRPLRRTALAGTSVRLKLYRQADIVLGERASRAASELATVVELGELALAVEGIVVGKRCSICVIHQEKRCAFQTRSQAGLRIALQQIAAAGLVEGLDRARQHAHVGDREVHALGAGRRHDVRGIAGQEQPAVLHRLDDEAAHRR